MRRLTLLTLPLLVLAIFAWPPHGMAQVSIDPGSPHVAQFWAVYDAMPAAWHPRYHVVVREMDDAEMDKFTQEEMGIKPDSLVIVDGLYESDRYRKHEDIITIRSMEADEEDAMTFAHEWGHEVWCRVLTSSDRARYRRIWHQQKRAGNLVSDYAGFSVGEGFAEAFSYWCRRPESLNEIDPRSWQFLREIERHAITP